MLIEIESCNLCFRSFGYETGDVAGCKDCELEIEDTSTIPPLCPLRDAEAVYAALDAKFYLHNNVPEPTCAGRWWIQGEKVYDPYFNDNQTIIEVWHDGGGLTWDHQFGDVRFTGPIPEPPMKGDDVL